MIYLKNSQGGFSKWLENINNIYHSVKKTIILKGNILGTFKIVFEKDLLHIHIPKFSAL